MIFLAMQSACVTTWEPQPVTPGELVGPGGDSEVRVRLANGSRVVLRDPAVEHDSLVGWVDPAWDSNAPLMRHAYALVEVREVAVRKNDLAPNVVLGGVAGTFLFVGVVWGAWAISCATHSCD